MSSFSSPSLSILGEALEQYRKRQDWNDRFTHWERPASVSEEGTIERAQANVQAALANNQWLTTQGVVIRPQGSYYNNTNVRTEADIDLRMVHPSLKILYANNVHQESAQTILSYIDHSLTYGQIFSAMRAEAIRDLSARFGPTNIDIGNKAIRIKGITGSRAEVDVVPTIRLHHVTWLPAEERYCVVEGVAILSTSNAWTLNFPEQHTSNGIAKRARTAHRFKKVVRVFKRLRADMTDRGILKVKIPSFLVECLVYMIEDEYFMVESDDRYGRIKRIAVRMQEILRDQFYSSQMTEINGVKKLFYIDQAWSYQDSKTFVDTILLHLGDC